MTEVKDSPEGSSHNAVVTALEEAMNTPPSEERKDRLDTLKEIILHLHRGEAPDAVRERLKVLIDGVDPSEVAAMEQRLIEDGMSLEEVKSMCDLHAEVLSDAVTPPSALPSLPSGHPARQLMDENAALKEAIAKARESIAFIGKTEIPANERRLRALEAFQPLTDVDKHYRRKEHLFFSILERHGTLGPSKVMWGKDDEAREVLKAAMTALRQEDIATVELEFLAQTVLKSTLKALDGMIFKEENILLPMCLEMFTKEEWGDIWRQSPEYGWCLVAPGDEYRPPESVEGDFSSLDGAGVRLPSGLLSYPQLLGIFNTLPVDITFVDADDRVAFFSEGTERVFERSRVIIGRDVRNCHPPKSMHVVDQILEDFRSGRRSVAEFWIQMGPKFVHIRYFAVRDGDGAYLGTLEVTQDIARMRALEGQRRLLQYDED